METTEIKNNKAFKVTRYWDNQSKKCKVKFLYQIDADQKFEMGNKSDLQGIVKRNLNSKA
jgi:hypothetical protein